MCFSPRTQSRRPTDQGIFGGSSDLLKVVFGYAVQYPVEQTMFGVGVLGQVGTVGNGFVVRRVVPDEPYVHSCDVFTARKLA